MRKSLFGASALLAALMFVAPGCGGDDDKKSGSDASAAAGASGSDGGSAGAGGTGGTGGAKDAGSAGSAGSDAGSAGAGGAKDGGAAGDAGTTATVTYTTGIKPIVMAKCATSGCHGAAPNKWLEYAQTQESAYTTPECVGKKKGECMIIRVKNGSMPRNKNCSGNPATDAAKSAVCLTAAEQKTFEDWVAGGLKE